MIDPAWLSLVALRTCFVFTVFFFLILAKPARPTLRTSVQVAQPLAGGPPKEAAPERGEQPGAGPMARLLSATCCGTS